LAELAWSFFEYFAASITGDGDALSLCVIGANTPSKPALAATEAALADEMGHTGKSIATVFT